MEIYLKFRSQTTPCVYKMINITQFPTMHLKSRESRGNTFLNYVSLKCICITKLKQSKNIQYFVTSGSILLWKIVTEQENYQNSV